MNLSDVMGGGDQTQRPMRLSQIQAPPKPQKLSDITPPSAEKPSRLASAVQPFKEIGSDIAQDFREGSERVGRGEQQLGKGEILSGAGNIALGVLGQTGAPATGAARAIVGDPMRRNIPQDTMAGRFAANLGEDVAGIVGPGLVSKAVKRGAEAIPALIGKEKPPPPPKQPDVAPKPPQPAAPDVGLPAEGPMTRPPALTKPREFEDQLFQLDKQREADAIEAKQKLDAVPKGVKPETWDKLYHYEESQMERPLAGTPDKVPLTAEEKDLYDKHIAPIRAEANQQMTELMKLGIELPDDVKAEVASIERPGYTPRYAAGRTRSFGEVLDQWKNGVEARFGGAAGRSMRKTVDAQKGRRFYVAVNPETSEKRVVALARNGNVLGFDGTAKPVEIGTRPAGQPLSPGSKVRVGDSTWTLEDATTKEIEAAAGQKYSTNLLANRLDNLAKLNSAVRNAKFIKGMTESPEWGGVAQKVSELATPPEGFGGRPWRIPKLPQFRQWYVEPRLADALDDFARDTHGNLDALNSTLQKVGRMMNFVMFLNPKAHIDNVFNHMMVEGGLVGNVVGAPNMVKNLIKAQRDVLTASPMYVRSLRAGASLPYARMLSGDLHDTLLRKLGGEAERDPKPWNAMVQAAGYLNAKDMLKHFASVPQRALWAASDIMTLAREYQKMDHGMPLEHAFRETEKGMPNYRVPGQVMGSRGLSQLFGNPAVGRFGRYQYGRAAGYFRLLNSAFGKDRSTMERAKAFDKMAMLGLYLTVLYPAFDEAWKAATGNQNAETTRSGAASIPQAVIDVTKGKKSIGDLPQSMFTAGVPVEMPIELYRGRYLWSGEPIVHQADVDAGRYGTVAKDIGKYAAGNLSTVGQMVNPEGTMDTEQMILGALGVKAPTDQQVAARDRAKRFEAQKAKRRAMKLDRQ